MVKKLYITEKQKKAIAAQEQVGGKSRALVPGVADGGMMCESVGKDFNLKKEIASLMAFISSKINIKPYPKIIFKDEEQDGLFIKTGYYLPDEKSVTLFTAERHPKDILRSLAHELVHHNQNLEDPDRDWGHGGNLEEDEELKKLESDAFLRGNILFREWTETQKPRQKQNINESVNPKQEKWLRLQATETYGITDDFAKAGFILTTGELLDLSNGEEKRNMVHGALDVDGANLQDFLNVGEIRLQPEGPGIEFSQRPTDIQMTKIKEFVTWAGKSSLFVDYTEHGHVVWGKEYKAGSNDSLEKDIERYFSEGIEPKTGGNDVLDGYSITDFLEENIEDEMTAYHGSAAYFTKFDEKHLCSGEGAFAYGWGTYVTTNQSTGEHYAHVAMETNGKSQGFLYQVEIPDDNGANYINIQGNAPAVYTRIEQILMKEFPNCNKGELHQIIKYCRDRKVDSFQWFFDQIESAGISSRAVSKALDRNGIVGVRVPVKYREAGVGDEGYNYTIFRAKNVRIIKRTPVTMNEEYREQDIDLSSFNIQKNLNPKFWKDGHLDSRIRKKLLDIADDFVEYLGVDWVEPEDIIMTGSLANYNWSKKYSDIDLHILMDFEDVDERKDFVKKYFDSKKSEWNEKHKDIKIYGFEVEVYVQDVNEKHASHGVYSVDKDKWLTEPNREDLVAMKVNKKTIRTKVANYMNLIDNLEDSFMKSKSNEKENGQVQGKAEELFDKIKNERREELSKNGNEISNGNIIFKTLRRNGYLDKLVKLKTKAYDKMNSLT